MATRIREKAEKIAKTREKRPHANVKHIRITPSKAKVVLDLVRGKSVGEAVAILENINNASAVVVKKLINSAAANGENNMSLSKADLYVAECFATPGPTMKRMMPRAKGSGNIILKRTCHIFVVLDSKVKE